MITIALLLLLSKLPHFGSFLLQSPWQTSLNGGGYRFRTVHMPQSFSVEEEALLDKLTAKLSNPSQENHRTQNMQIQHVTPFNQRQPNEATRVEDKLPAIAADSRNVLQEQNFQLVENTLKQSAENLYDSQRVNLLQKSQAFKTVQAKSDQPFQPFPSLQLAESSSPPVLIGVAVSVVAAAIAIFSAKAGKCMFFKSLFIYLFILCEFLIVSLVSSTLDNSFSNYH
jgi:hypothetical protein